MKVSTVEEDVLSMYEQKFKALSDKNRLRIIFKLSQRGKVYVCDLTDMLDLSQSKLSYHLKMLLDANILTLI